MRARPATSSPPVTATVAVVCSSSAESTTPGTSQRQQAEDRAERHVEGQPEGQRPDPDPAHSPTGGVSRSSSRSRPGTRVGAPGNPATAVGHLDHAAARPPCCRPRLRTAAPRLACRMPIPTGDTPFDSLVAELVADQLRANPVLASGLGRDRARLRAARPVGRRHRGRERAEDDWVAAAARGRRHRAHRRPAHRPRPRPDGAARPRAAARLGRLAADARPLRRRRPVRGLRPPAEPAAT